MKMPLPHAFVVAILLMTTSVTASASCTYGGKSYADKEKLCVNGTVLQCKKDGWVDTWVKCAVDGEEFRLRTSDPNSPIVKGDKAEFQADINSQSMHPTGDQVSDLVASAPAPAWYCRVVWDFKWSDRIFEGRGPNEQAAFAAAQRDCQWKSFNMPDAWICGTKPKSRKCNEV